MVGLRCSRGCSGHASGLVPSDIVVAVRADPNIASSVGVDTNRLAIVPNRAIAGEHPRCIPNAVGVYPGPVLPCGAVPRHCVSPDTRHGVLDRLPVDDALRPNAVSTFVAVSLVVLVEPVVQPLVVDDPVRIVVPALGRCQVIYRIVRIVRHHPCPRSLHVPNPRVKFTETAHPRIHNPAQSVTMSCACGTGCRHRRAVAPA